MLRSIAKSEHLKNPWLVFSPFLVLYLLIVVIFKEDALGGDGERYLLYARNLLAGYYSPLEEVHLWNSPGYPLLLTPLVALGAPLLAMTLPNAAFQYLSVVYLYKTTIRYSSFGFTMFFSVLWGLHFTSFELLPMIMTEPLVMFLISLLAYFVSLTFQEESIRKVDRNLLIAGIILGFVVLTKAVFSYVLLFTFAAVLMYWLFSREKKKSQKALLILTIAILVNVPYLVYTYNLTGRMFYWADSGGMSLYWMSTPYENEYGDWQADDFSAGFKGRNTQAIRQNHEADYAEIYRLSGVERDDLFKKKAVENIKSHPKKYVTNWIANVNRLFFGFPNSYQYENLKFLKMFPNIFLVGLIFYSLVVSLFNLRRIPFELLFLLALTFIYLGLSTLVSTYPRMLLVINPILFLWIAYAVDRTISFHLIFSSKK